MDINTDITEMIEAWPLLSCADRLYIWGILKLRRNWRKYIQPINVVLESQGDFESDIRCVDET